MTGIVLGDIDTNDLRYTAEKACETTEFWKEKFMGTNIDELTPNSLLSATDKVFITPHDLYNADKLWPTYIKNLEIFHGVMRTSGTTGDPKRVPFTHDDKKRYRRQARSWALEYLEGSIMASFTAPLPSSSGVFAIEGFSDANIRYHQIPIHYLRMRDALIKELRGIKATGIFGLTAAVYNLSLTLPEDIRNDIQLIIMGGETLTKELAKVVLDSFPNAVIFDVFANTEDGLTGYRLITKKKVTPFTFSDSLIVLKQTKDEEYKEYHEIYITKVMKEGELTGLPLFNYKIGDLAKVVDGKIVNVIREKDTISLAGAKLHIDQVMDIVHRYPSLIDFVIIYHPLSPENPKPKATIRVGYMGEKPAGVEDEIRELIYEANNPVRYEVEEAKSSELRIEAVPAKEVRKNLPQKPGKTKRIFIVGKDI